MPSRTYLALSGPSEWATFNALWAVLRHSDFLPDQVVIATFQEDADRAARAAARMGVLLDAYGHALEPRVVEVDDASVETVCDAFKALFQAEAGNEVAMDVTNGRKMMALCALKAWDIRKLEHLFYLYIRTLDDADHPYMCIPLSRQQLCDLKEEGHAR